MKRTTICLAGVCALLFGALSGDAAASELPLRMTNVSVAGGEASWHPTPEFQLEWDTSPAFAELVTAAGHRVLDPLGLEVPYSRTKTTHPAGFLRASVPDVPGIYTAEAWLESIAGMEGPHVTAKLRFDDRAPGPAEPLAPTGWITGRTHAEVSLRHPSLPLPISGLRGYAYSIDRDQAGSPCSGATLCTAGETDLDGGAEDDRIVAPLLPEGIDYIHVVAVSGSGVRSADVRTAAIRVDATYPQLRLDGASSGWSRVPVTVAVTATDRQSGMLADGADGPFTAIAIDDAAATRQQGGVVTAAVREDGTHRISYFARDAAGNVNDGADEAPPPETATVRIDGSPPRVAFAPEQDPADPERIEATVSDPLSGPSPERGAIEIRAAGTAAAFESLPTEVNAGRLVARWDSDSHPAGRYELRATGWDVAGNSATTNRRVGGAEMILANPVKEPVQLEAGFGGRQLVWQRCARHRGTRRCHRQVLVDFGARPLTRSVPFGHGVPFAGRALTASGRPAAGADVFVVEEFEPGAKLRSRTTSVRTDPEGFFVLRLGPGPSRRISAVFAGDRRLGHSASAPVSLSVLAAVHLAASRATASVGGRPVAFRGRIAAGDGRIPAAGRPVELQFRYPGASWSEFRTVQAGPSGRFRYPYAFSDDDSRGVRFLFRACTTSQPDWPYAPSCSRPVAVSGR